MRLLITLALAAGCGSKSPASVDAPAADAQVDAPGPDAPVARTIPITMVTLPNGDQVATVQVSIDGSTPITVLVDTGSVGLRVVTGAIPDADWTIGTTTSMVTYGSGVIATGVIATGTVTIGGLATTSAIAVQDITAVSCTTDKPNCPAKGMAAAAFRFSGQFPGILGVGLRATTEIASPLKAIGAHQQYTLSLPVLGGPTGLIAIDPDATALARFTTQVALTVKGAGFDDTLVPVCVNALCVGGLIDSGNPTTRVVAQNAADDMKLGVAAGATQIPAGTAVAIAIDTTATWMFTVGATPVAGKDLVDIGDATVTNNLGIAPFHQFDMFYDYAHGTIGFAPKP